MIQYIEKSKIKIDENLKIRSELNTSIAKSVRNEGVIYPLIVLKDFTLIDGFSRFTFATEGNLPVLIERDGKKAFLKSVEINMLLNPYSEFEKAKVVKCAINYFGFSEKDIVKEVNPLLKFGKKVSVIYDCLNIFNLEKSLFNLLERKKSPVSFALSLLKETEENQKLLAKVFEEKRLSLSRMQIAYDLMFYIRKRNSLEFKEIIAKCSEGDFIQCLEKLRFPQYIALKNELNKILSKYSGAINFPKDMEAGYFSFFTKIGDKKDIDKAIEILKLIENDKEVWEFLRKIKGND